MNNISIRYSDDVHVEAHPIRTDEEDLYDQTLHGPKGTVSDLIRNACPFYVRPRWVPRPLKGY